MEMLSALFCPCEENLRYIHCSPVASPHKGRMIKILPWLLKSHSIDGMPNSTAIEKFNNKSGRTDSEQSLVKTSYPIVKLSNVKLLKLNGKRVNVKRYLVDKNIKYCRKLSGKGVNNTKYFDMIRTRFSNNIWPLTSVNLFPSCSHLN